MLFKYIESYKAKVKTKPLAKYNKLKEKYVQIRNF